MTGNAIREALEPFAKAAQAFEIAIGPDSIDDGLTVEARISARPEREAVLSTADFSRARTAYEALSPVAVEEADAKAERKGHTPSDEEMDEATIRQRDIAEDAADKLAEAIGELLGVNVGEHSSAHSPWETALEHAGQAVRNRALSTYTAAGAGPVGEAVAWRDMASAPKDGTLLALLVRPYANDEDGAWTPFEDSRAPQPTIGFNNFDDTEEDRWQFAGWNWSQDCIVEGHGEVMGWRPFGEKLPSVTPEETVLAAIAEWGEGPCDDLEDLERRVLSCLSTHTAAGAGPVGEAVTWRDMASAPKDGTIIDLWHEKLGRQAECYWGKPEHCCGEAGQYCDSDWHREPEGWVHTAFNDVPYDADCFTHWMPSPAGPGAARPVEPGEVERKLAFVRSALNEKRYALRQIAGEDDDVTHTGEGHARCRKIARAALTGDAQEGGK